MYFLQTESKGFIRSGFSSFGKAIGGGGMFFYQEAYKCWVDSLFVMLAAIDV